MVVLGAADPHEGEGLCYHAGSVHFAEPVGEVAGAADVEDRLGGGGTIRPVGSRPTFPPYAR